MCPDLIADKMRSAEAVKQRSDPQIIVGQKILLAPASQNTGSDIGDGHEQGNVEEYRIRPVNSIGASIFNG
jgi:hypothetical protein